MEVEIAIMKAILRNRLKLVNLYKKDTISDRGKPHSKGMTRPLPPAPLLQGPCLLWSFKGINDDDNEEDSIYTAYANFSFVSKERGHPSKK